MPRRTQEIIVILIGLLLIAAMIGLLMYATSHITIHRTYEWRD